MKKFKLIFTCCAMLLVFGILHTQDLPVDPKFRIGKLDNGMTYYIRKNTVPEKRVELRLVVNSGSVQEDSDQLGIAHLVEHMCFNGTKHFPKNDLIHYLQSIGVGLGAELNGYTSFDETVYILRIPTDSSGILSQGIQIMRDWANDVTFDSTEIDKERGVIVEEWRLGLGAWDRMSKRFMPVMFKGSKYANRLPIGEKEIIETAPYNTIRRFYKDWYRPNLMALVVVGDIDIDSMEQKITQVFGDIKSPEHERFKEKFTVPDNDQTLSAVVSDKENANNNIFLIYKTDIENFKTISDFKKLVSYHLIAGMLNNRYNELKLGTEPPFIDDNVYYGNFWTRARNGLQIYLTTNENGIEKGLEGALLENERVKKYGFTQAEFARYKKTRLKELENQFYEQDKTESQVLVQQCIDHFLQGMPIPGPELEYTYAKKNFQGISLEDINALARRWINDRNRIIIALAINKPSVVLPTESDLQAVTDKVGNAAIEPYREKTIAQTLMNKLPSTAKVKNMVARDAGIIEVYFTNGTKVILKPTDFKNDEILLSAFCQGGGSVFSNKYKLAVEMAGEFKSENGVGNFSKSDLDKFLSGKNLKFNAYVDQYYSGINGSCSVSDFNTLLQLTYLNFTDNRKDVDAYLSFIERQKAHFKNLHADPETYFFDESRKIRYNRHPRIPWVLPQDSDWMNVTFKKVYEVGQKSFENANGFTFVLVGSFKTDTIIPYLERYFGSLPSSETVQSYKDLGIKPIAGPRDIKIYRGKDPKSFVCLFQDDPAEAFTKEESHMIWSLSNILNRMYNDTLRESMSGVYAVWSFGDVIKEPVPHKEFQVTIPCSPDNVDKLTNAVIEKIKLIQEKGVSAQDIEKERETQIRGIEREEKENGSWLWRIERVYKLGEDYTRLTNPKALTDLVTSENMQKIAKKYLNTDKMVRVVLYPVDDGK